MAHDATSTVIGNIFHRNEALGLWGSAVYAHTGEHGLMNNTTTLNEGVSAIHANSGTMTISNDIVWNNVGEELTSHPAAQVAVTYTLIEGGFPGTANFGADPQFLDPSNGDFRLPATSPAVESGDPAYEPCTLMDFGGYPRLLSAHLDAYAIIDRGAHEYGNVHLTISGDPTPGGTIHLEVTGHAGLPITMIVGTGMDGMCHPASGGLFFDMESPYLVIPFGTIPALRSEVIPPDVPTPLPLLFQLLGRDPAWIVGNTSNPKRVTIE